MLKNKDTWKDIRAKRERGFINHVFSFLYRGCFELWTLFILERECLTRLTCKSTFHMLTSQPRAYAPTTPFIQHLLLGHYLSGQTSKNGPCPQSSLQLFKFVNPKPSCTTWPVSSCGNHTHTHKGSCPLFPAFPLPPDPDAPKCVHHVICPPFWDLWVKNYIYSEVISCSFGLTEPE